MDPLVVLGLLAIALVVTGVVCAGLLAKRAHETSRDHTNGGRRSTKARLRGALSRSLLLKRFFIREAAGLSGEAPRLMRGEAL